MRDIIESENLKNTVVYFDNVIIGANSLKELEHHASRFQSSMKSRDMTLNDSKTIYGVNEVNILGYCVGNNQIKPDPDRLKPLLELPPPSSGKSLQRALGLFAYYSKWIPNFSDRIGRLKMAKEFPLLEKEISDFEGLKEAIATAALQAIDESLPFTVECDASDIAVSATLNQNGRPVAFMSRTLQKSELAYPAIEKEATAIIEAVRKWSHLLIRQHFYLVTDQRSVAFMLDSRKRTKIKNNKIMCWRLELASFSYSIRYRPGINNVGPDTLTRAFCASVSNVESNLETLHKELCCPGVTRLWHFVRSRNLPYSLEDVKRCCSKCQTCAEIKPTFYTPDKNVLIKATQPMERFNIDFKGPLPSSTRNCYFLCIVDEFSRYPFCFPCPDVSTDSVIGCLEKLFALFGTCSYVHSDRGSSFMSKRFKDYLLRKGISSSRTTPYHPQGNSQCERFNGIVWKAVKCALRSRNLSTEKWESVLSEALSSIRSLLCTSTNETPHSRFFGFTRRLSHGKSLPEWLCKQGPVLLRKFVRSGNNDDKVRKVDLVEANPMYARIRYPDGRESNVSLRDLARCPLDSNNERAAVGEDNSSSSKEDNREACSSPIAAEGYGNDRRETEGINEEPSGDQDDTHNYESMGRANEIEVASSSRKMDEGGIGVEPRRSSRFNKGVPSSKFDEFLTL
jgi:hypothetical protein